MDMRHFKEVPKNNNLSVYKPAFPKYEFLARQTKLSQLINRENLDSIILFSPSLLYYFTGFTGSSFYVPQFLFYNKKEIFLILRNLDSQAAHTTTYLTNNEILSYPDDCVDNEKLHPIKLFNNLIKKTDKIGLELNGYYSRARYYIEFKKFSDNIIDITYSVNLIRSIKSTNELNYIRKAADLANESIQAGIESIKENVTTAEVASKIINYQILNNGTYTAIQPMIMVNENSGHMNWTNDKLEKGQIIIIEAAASYQYYHCPISRTIFVGNADDLKNSIYKDISKIEIVLQEAMIEILNIIKPGIKCSYLKSIFDDIMYKHKIIKNSRIGYSFGIGYPPDWGENTISIRNCDENILEEGMCIHLIFGSGDSWGYQYSEAIIVTINGPELLHTIPRILFTDENKSFDILSNNASYISTINKFTNSFHEKYKNWESSIIKGFNIHTSLRELFDPNVYNFHKNNTYFEYNKTKLYSIKLDNTKVLIKDESNRMNSTSFKILGVSYAVHQLIKKGKIKNNSVLTSMTDGNHGNALAIVGNKYSLRVVIYVPKNTIQERIDNIKNNGAEVIVIDGTYDDAVKYVEEQSILNKWILISDQAWNNYEEIPTYIMNGYTTLFKEALDEAEELGCIPTHIITQTGVGGLTAAGAIYSNVWYSERNLTYTHISVEAYDANCFEESIQNIYDGNKSELKPTKRNTNSIMAGLNCGIPSSVAWPIIKDSVDYYITVGDQWAKWAVKLLWTHGIKSGESGCAGFAGLLAFNDKLEINKDSIVLIINTEGITDTSLFNEIVTLY